jgi:hypothetical protein
MFRCSGVLNTMLWVEWRTGINSVMGVDCRPILSGGCMIVWCRESRWHHDVTWLLVDANQRSWGFAHVWLVPWAMAVCASVRAHQSERVLLFTWGRASPTAAHAPAVYPARVGDETWFGFAERQAQAALVLTRGASCGAVQLLAVGTGQSGCLPDSQASCPPRARPSRG